MESHRSLSVPDNPAGVQTLSGSLDRTRRVNKRGHVLNAILLSIGIGFIFEPTASRATAEMVAAVFVPIVVGALLPDVDTAFGTHRKTLHNLPVLCVVLAYPLVFDNLHFVWLGVLTHYVLDLTGSQRGLALLYPLWGREFGLPLGVSTNSDSAPLVTVVITGFELACFAVVHYSVVSLRGNVDGLVDVLPV